MRKLGLHKLPAKHALIARLGSPSVWKCKEQDITVAYEFAVKLFSHVLPQFSVIKPTSKQISEMCVT